MTDVRTSSSLAETTKLWRYIKFERLVDLLSTGEIFFAPLSSYVNSDPFEGYLPAVAMDADAGIFQAPVSDIELFVKSTFTHNEQKMLHPALADLKSTARKAFIAITRCSTVSCWHANDDESEAMWRLYSGGRKQTVAIETTLDALKVAIQLRHSVNRVHIYPVKYLDFFDTKLKPIDCVVEGLHRSPLLKRRSYKHENEVRAFINPFPGTPSSDLSSFQPIPIRLPVDVKTLIKRVHVSPYAAVPFGKKVRKACKSFGLDEDLVEPSRLLLGHEELLKRLDL